MDFRILSGIFLGWSLGANNSSSVFGTAVSTHIIRYRTAIILCAFFVFLGAGMGGHEGLRTFSVLSEGWNPNEVFVAALGAAVSTFLMTVMKVPVSISQAIVGSIIGVGLADEHGVVTTGLAKIFICWVGTPIGAMLIGFLLYTVLARLLNKLELNFFQTDSLFRWGLLLSGIYGSYALGANNVANVTGIYVGAGMMSETMAAWVGGMSIAFGVLTYSRSVMLTVGKGLIPLNGLGALTAVLSQAIVVHFYSWVGVPVSVSQAIVGSVIAVGLMNGRSICLRTLLKIINGWFLTPVISCFFTWILVKIFLVS